MNDSPGLDALRTCLEGVIPSVIATVDTEGTPNITYVSQVHYVDKEHVALSFQFFNKTRENILNNPYAIQEIEKATRIKGVPFEGKTVVTKEQVSSFFEVTPRTIDNYIEKFSDERFDKHPLIQSHTINYDKQNFFITF